MSSIDPTTLSPFNSGSVEPAEIVPLNPTNDPAIIDDRKNTPDPNRELTVQQRLFVDFYAAHGDPIKACVDAGFPAKNAKRLSNTYLNDPKYVHVALAAERAFRVKRDELGVSSAQIVNELVKIAFFNPKRLLNDEGQVLNLHEIPDDVAINIKKIKVQHKVGINKDGEPVRDRCTELEFWNKLDAINQLGKHLGLHKEAVKQNNTININWNQLMLGQEATQQETDPVEARIEALNVLPAAINALVAKGEIVKVPENMQSGTPKVQPLHLESRDLPDEADVVQPEADSKDH